MRWPIPLLSGFLFALGLGLSGMTQPAKVVGFLDFAGKWDPTLAFVMGGAIAVHVLGRLWGRGRKAPVAAEVEVSSEVIDGRLIAGAALFGVGWGLIGYCPGPALVALSAGAAPALTVVLSMVAGGAIHQFSLRARRPAAGEPLAVRVDCA